MRQSHSNALPASTVLGLSLFFNFTDTYIKNYDTTWLDPCVNTTTYNT